MVDVDIYLGEHSSERDFRDFRYPCKRDSDITEEAESDTEDA